MEEVDPKPGDLIEISRKVYQHWAVYVGSGFVVHLTPSNDGSSSAQKAVVKKELLSMVAGTDRYCVNNKHDSKYHVRSPDEIVYKAEMLVGQTMEYKLLSQNCEHFANNLRYGVARCDQVPNLAKLRKETIFSSLSGSSNVDPKPGDLIEISRMCHRHWAVYVGSDYVIHLTRSNGGSSCGFSCSCSSSSSSMNIFARRAVVKKELLFLVAGTNRYCVNNKHDSKYHAWSPDEIVYKAEMLVGQTMEYNPFSKNSEHFATCLRYGVVRSDQATAEANNLVAVASAKDLYYRRMEKICGGDKPYVAPELLEVKHQKQSVRALEHFRRIKKMGGREFSQRYEDELMQELSDLFEDLAKHNQRKKIFNTFRTLAIHFAMIVVLYVTSGITKYIGLSVVAQLCNLIVGLLILSLLAWGYIQYSGKSHELGIVIDNIAAFVLQKIWAMGSLVHVAPSRDQPLAPPRHRTSQ
ncbi:uncharacterized protein LOC131186571 [Ahaetulla prasina]|uniref:uncharacterized protein LOC131186571 n=1 Tax=Ahaetulla prasina TaxID=499056 RepID=UPI0026483F45|nr:uncharacterized protein LOC131186571 [Ahaetulla prasina]